MTRARLARLLSRPLVASSALALAAALVPSEARADDTIKHPGDHPAYSWEAEPHLALAWDNPYYGLGGNVNGIGLGFRASIPIVDNGFVKTINNSVAITFGVDWLHYGGNCRYRDLYYDCSVNTLDFPIAMQWNFFVAQKWSVFGEPGLYIWHGFFDTGVCPAAGCGLGSDTGVRPAFFAGARYHFNEKITLTMRVGYPTISVGVSWLL